MAKRPDRVLTERQKLTEKMKVLERDYNQYRQPEITKELKLTTFDQVWDIFGRSVVTPEAAPFVVGRLYQAVDGYRRAMATVTEYEATRDKLAELAKLEAGIDLLPESPGQ